MNKINYNEVPYGFMHCLEADCPMASHCLRQLAMQAVPKDQIGVLILNPQLPEPSDKCKYYRSDEPQVYGKGFQNMQKYMLPGQYDTFRYRLIGKFGRTSYFERRRGERLCSPADIEVVKKVLSDIGLPELEFDGYQKQLNFWD